MMNLLRRFPYNNNNSQVFPEIDDIQDVIVSSANDKLAVKRFLNFIYENITKLSSQDTKSIQAFEVFIRTQIESYSLTHVRTILCDHGYSPENGCVKMAKDFDSLFVSMCSLYLFLQTNESSENKTIADLMPQVHFSDTFIQLNYFSHNRVGGNHNDNLANSEILPNIKSYSFKTILIRIVVPSMSKIFSDIQFTGSDGIDKSISYGSNMLEGIFNAIYISGGDVLSVGDEEILCIVTPLQLKPKRDGVNPFVFDQQSFSWHLDEKYSVSDLCLSAIVLSKRVMKIFSEMQRSASFDCVDRLKVFITMDDIRFDLCRSSDDQIQSYFLPYGKAIDSLYEISKFSGMAECANDYYIFTTETFFNFAKVLADKVDGIVLDIDKTFEALLAESNENKIINKNINSIGPIEMNRFYLITCSFEDSRWLSNKNVHINTQLENMLTARPILNLLTGGETDVGFMSSLNPFLSKPLYSATLSENINSTYDCKVVNVLNLCADFSPFLVTSSCSCGSSTALCHDKLNSIHELIQHALSVSGGYLYQMVLENDCCHLIVIWGVSNCNFSNNSSRALRFAFDLKAKLTHLNDEVSVSASISLGPVFCGVMGSIIRKEFVCFGTVILVASSLLDMTESCILIDEGTYSSLTFEEKKCFIAAPCFNDVKCNNGGRSRTQQATHISSLNYYTFVALELPNGAPLHTNILLSDIVLSDIMQSLDRIKCIDRSSVRSASSSDHIAENYNINSNHDGVIRESLNDCQIGNHGIFFTIITGGFGSGKNVVVEIFKEEAMKRDITFIHLTAKGGDELNPFSMLRMLFLNLIGSESPSIDYLCDMIEVIDPKGSSYYNPARRREITLLIEQVFGVPNLSLGVIPTAFPEKTDMETDSNITSFFSRRVRVSPRQISSDRIIKQQVTSDNPILKFLYVLLADKSFVIIIENSNYCDELSWNEFNALKYAGNQLSVMFTFIFESHMIHNNHSDSLSSGVRKPRNSISESVDQAHNKVLNDNSISVRLGSKRYFSHRKSYSFEVDNSRKTYVEQSISISKHNSRDSPSKQYDKNVSSLQSVLALLSNSSSITNKKISISSHDLEKIQSLFGFGSPPNGSFLSILQNKDTSLIEMKGLQYDDIANMIRPRVQASLCYEDENNAVSKLAKLILKVSNGSTFWIKLILELIDEQGLLDFENVVEKGEVENSCGYIILSRFEKMPFNQQMVVKYGSVIGCEFTLEALTYILPETLHSSITKSLEMMVHSDLMFCLSDHLIPIYCFQNMEIQQSIYSLLSQSELAKIHFKIASFMEGHFEDLKPYYLSLSHHYRHCLGKRSAAFKYTILSLDHCLSRGAYSSGLALAQQAREFALSRPESKLLLDIVTVGLEDLKLLVARKAAIKNAGNVSVRSNSSRRSSKSAGRFKRDDARSVSKSLTFLDHTESIQVLLAGYASLQENLLKACELLYGLHNNVEQFHGRKGFFEFLKNKELKYFDWKAVYMERRKRELMDLELQRRTQQFCVVM